MSEQAPIPTTDTEAIAQLAQVRVRLEEQTFAGEQARLVIERLQSEIRKVEHRFIESETLRASLRNRLDERERYIGAIHASRAWKGIQWLRGLVGRRW
jgi:chromosome segregation ATPase